jgi:hypothetical protein
MGSAGRTLQFQKPLRKTETGNREMVGGTGEFGVGLRMHHHLDDNDIGYAKACADQCRREES